METTINVQFEILQRLKYYESAYSSSIRLLKAMQTGSEGQLHLFSAAKYYQDKINNLRKELRSL